MIIERIVYNGHTITVEPDQNTPGHFAYTITRDGTEGSYDDEYLTPDEAMAWAKVEVDITEIEEGMNAE